MRPLAVCLLLATVAIAAPSCDGEGGGGGGGGGGGERPPPSEREGVVLTLDRDTPHAGETLQLTVENHTRTRLEYGLAYKLERRMGDRWVWINKDAAFALLLKVIEPGKREREDILLPDDIRPDRYRIVKSFSAPATGRELGASVGFTVANR